jgi:predicted nucleic acid-binding Zn ribbon protein
VTIQCCGSDLMNCPECGGSTRKAYNWVSWITAIVKENAYECLKCGKIHEQLTIYDFMEDDAE